MVSPLSPPPAGKNITSPQTTSRATGKTRPPLLASPPPLQQEQGELLSASSSSPVLFDVRVLGVDSGDDNAKRWYNVRIVCRLRPDLSWRVTRRYREFDALAAEVQREVTRSGGAVEMPRLPPKLLAPLLSAADLQRRVLGLQRWSQQMLSIPCLLAHPKVIDFFDLSFGLWYIRDDVAPPTLLVDPAQQRAAAQVQAHVRRRHAQSSLRTQRSAVVVLQRAARRYIAVRSAASDPTWFIDPSSHVAAAWTFAPSLAAHGTNVQFRTTPIAASYHGRPSQQPNPLVDGIHSFFSGLMHVQQVSRKSSSRAPSRGRERRAPSRGRERQAPSQQGRAPSRGRSASRVNNPQST